MSHQKIIRRKISADIKNSKNKEPIVCLTAYSYPMASILDDHCDLLLVGDSLGMVLYGMDSTLPVTLDMMIEHTKAVMRGSSKSCVIIDMPFGTYQMSKEQAYQNSVRALKETGCQGIKIEGGIEMAETIRFLVDRGIAVMAHIGLKPQSFNVCGGYKVQGRDKEAKTILYDAKAVEEAGAFSVVIESVPHLLADEITKEVSIPTIGIGASKMCDGQILVTDDMIGLTQGRIPKFVKKYADINKEISHAIFEYSKDVKAREFPTKDNIYE